MAAKTSENKSEGGRNGSSKDGDGETAKLFKKVVEKEVRNGNHVCIHKCNNVFEILTCV